MKCANTNISFKSGLTSNILRQESKICPQKTTQNFRTVKNKSWGMLRQTDFKNNQAMALANMFCSEIFKKFRAKVDYVHDYSLLNLALPQDIFVYNSNEGAYKDRGYFFTNVKPLKTEENLPPFAIGTVFINNDCNSLEYLNSLVEQFYRTNNCSSSHFLQPIIHEWLHAIQNRLINNVCYNHAKSYERTLINYQSQKLNNAEKEVIFDVVGDYPIKSEKTQYSELFAEAWAKFICESLNEDCMSLKQNPLDLMMKTPKEFQQILKKASLIEFK